MNISINLGRVSDKNLYSVFCQMLNFLIPWYILCWCEVVAPDTKVDKEESEKQIGL